METISSEAQREQKTTLEKKEWGTLLGRIGVVALAASTVAACVENKRLSRQAPEEMFANGALESQHQTPVVEWDVEGTNSSGILRAKVTEADGHVYDIALQLKGAGTGSSFAPDGYLAFPDKDGEPQLVGDVVDAVNVVHYPADAHGKGEQITFKPSIDEQGKHVLTVWHEWFDKGEFEWQEITRKQPIG